MIKYIAVFTFIFSALGTNTYAQSSEDTTNTTKAFHNMDANDDGILITAEVINANKKLFNRLDQNNNYTLEINEILSHDPDPSGKFKTTDTDNDGKVSLQEYINQKVKTFRVLDSNNDGKMTQQEYVNAKNAYIKKHYELKRTNNRK